MLESHSLPCGIGSRKVHLLEPLVWLAILGAGGLVGWLNKWVPKYKFVIPTYGAGSETSLRALT